MEVVAKSIAENVGMLRNTYAVMRSDRPLSVGIKSQIAANHPELSAKEIQAALSHHTKTATYLFNLKFGTVRVNLDGTVSSEITDEQREVARLRLNERAARRVQSKARAGKPDDTPKKKANRERRHAARLVKIQGQIVQAVTALSAVS